MCIAALQTKGHTIAEPNLRKMFSSNPDGAGIAYIKEGKVVIDKGHMLVDDFVSAYNKIKEGGFFDTDAALVHCRIATMGEIGLDNSHPFMVRDGAMIHNGMLFGGGRDEKKSDTRIFCERLYIDLTFQQVTANKKALGKELAGNKLAFLYNDGKYAIVNEDAGMWDNGVWYSNSGYKIYNRNVN